MINFLVSDEITRGEFFSHLKKRTVRIDKLYSYLSSLPPFKILLSRKQIECCEINSIKKKEIDSQTLLY